MSSTHSLTHSLASSLTASDQKVRNPKTGRMILVGKGVYNKLIAEGYVLRGNALIKGASITSEHQTLTGIGDVTTQMSQVSITPQPVITHQPVITPQPNVSIGKTEVPTQQVIPGSSELSSEVPVTTGLRKEFIESVRADRKEMCGICQKEYIDRISNLRPFLKTDYNLLKNRVSPACERCVVTIEHEIKLSGRDPNIFETYRRFKQVDVQAKQRLGQIETQIRTDAIRMASAGAMDPGIFFPSVPTSLP